MKSRHVELTPDDPIFSEGLELVLVPLTSAPPGLAPQRRIVRGRRRGGMPSVFENDRDMFDESTWIGLDE